MSAVDLDLRRLEPGEAPRPDDVAAAAEAPSRCSSAGPVPALAAVLAVLLKADRHRAGAGRLGAGRRPDSVGAGPRPRRRHRRPQRELALVRDDHGGVLLHHGRIEAAGDGRRSLSRRLGLQAHHDDIKVADGEITRIDVRPDWRAVDTHRRHGDAAAAAPDAAAPAAGRCRWPPTRPGSCATASRTRARSPAGPGTPTTGCAGCSSPDAAPPRSRQARRGHWAAPLPAEEAPLPTSRAPTGPGARACR